jgi:hypothetical protein
VGDPLEEGQWYYLYLEFNDPEFRLVIEIAPLRCNLYNEKKGSYNFDYGNLFAFITLNFLLTLY